MKVRLPVRSFNRINIVLAIGISGTVWMFLSHSGTAQDSSLYTIMTAILITFIGFANTFILVQFAKKFKIESWNFRLYRYTFSYGISLVAYLTIGPLFSSLTGNPPSFVDPLTWGAWILGSYIINTLLVVLHNYILVQSQKAQADLELSHLKVAHAEAAILLLKQQIQPHFLFNALNTVKALYKKDLRAGDTYVIHLANFLRASISTHDTKVSRLDEELSLLNDYLEMQKMRFGKALNFSLAVPEQSLENYYLPSFSLQPLLENAIKHNNLTEMAPLNVVLFQQNDRIIMTNNRQQKSVKVDSTNHGLANLIDRYRLLSGDEVVITESEVRFCVSIKLLTDEYNHH